MPRGCQLLRNADSQRVKRAGCTIKIPLWWGLTTFGKNWYNDIVSRIPPLFNFLLLEQLQFYFFTHGKKIQWFLKVRCTIFDFFMIYCLWTCHRLETFGYLYQTENKYKRITNKNCNLCIVRFLLFYFCNECILMCNINIERNSLFVMIVKYH